MELVQNAIVANKFRLERELGRGGMGSVWLAHHQELDIPCAVKFIEGEAANSAEMRERFTREARAAAQLRSPHVVQILDQGVWDGAPYIAMEFLDGEDLGDRLHRLGRIDAEQTVAILSQVARALAKAHAAGIVHRDLKPDNIFLVRDDERELVKILDFGIAKMSNQALGKSANTRTGTLLGTPYYMSPEQAQGNKTVDARSDVWAIGVISFEMLTGKRPFDSDALGDLLLKVCAHPIPRILEAAPDLPPAVEKWWSRASNRDPAERFQTTKELVDELASALGVVAGGDVRSAMSSDSGSLPGRTFSPQATTGGRTVSPLTLSDAEARPGRSPMVWAVAGALGLLAVGVAAVAMRRPPAPVADHAIQPPVASVAARPPVVDAPSTAAPVAPVASATPVAASATAAPSAKVAKAEPAGAKVEPASAKAPATSKPVVKPVAPKTPTDEAGF